MIFKTNTKHNAVTGLCNELIRSYAVLKRQNPDEIEFVVCEKLWSFWYMQNRERIWKEYNDLQCERLEELRVKRSIILLDDEIYKVFTDFLIIETGIEELQQKEYINAVKQLYKQLKKAGLATNTPLKIIVKEVRNK